MIHLRPVEEKDTLFIEAVYRSTREAELALTNWTELQKQAFIVMQSIAQLTDYKKKYPGAIYQIIVCKKKEVGRLITWETNDTIHILDISLLTSSRGKGTGTIVMQQLIAKAGSVQKKLSLHVLPHNPALKLYRRLGFEIIKNNGDHFYMERKPVKGR
ncbi:MAG: GNAT family N-acetyltransferase [Sphingobacteriales bacterium]|nr:GNAT family N-acetyltransferase [Sphingobacteriales bacterium]